MRVLSWNVQRAKANDEVWDILSALDVDICFLQEVSSIPEQILDTLPTNAHCLHPPADARELRDVYRKYHPFLSIYLTSIIGLKKHQLTKT